MIAGAQSIHIQDQRHAAVADQGGAGVAGQAAQGAGQGLRKDGSRFTYFVSRRAVPGHLTSLFTICVPYG
ncbi:hypothetical protein A7D01_16195 [Xanthomonas arboricola]|nr:hypothetical protein A7D01_16195 [Xanthomonas arboricola]